MSKWQPIETAPYGVDVLLYGSYLYPGDTALTKYTYVGSVVDSGALVETCCETMDSKNFTHWMPLPEPPPEEA